jgi:hexosaminidase
VLALILFAAIGLVGCGDEHSGTQPMELVPGTVDVIPRPTDVQVDPQGSVFVFDAQTVVGSEEEGRGAAALLVEILQGAFPGRSGPVDAPRAASRRNSVLLTTAGADPALGRDGYELEVTPERVELRALAAPGFVHGVQTLRQLLPPEVEQPDPPPGIAWSVPSVRIRDVPRFAWRGLMIDTSRTFLPKPFLLRELELLALYKVSVLHLHLTDDQGWRLQIDAYPALYQLGSQWDAQLAPNEISGYYTKDDVREIVARANALGIDVLPEIEMPGHIDAALHAMPDLACRTAPDQPRTADEFPIIPWSQRELSDDVLCVCDERVYAVMEAVLDEVIELFPGPFVHVGGDEVMHLDQWEAGYLCQDLIARGVVPSADHLQAYFEHRIETYLRSRGRRLLAWDEAFAVEHPERANERLSSAAGFQFWRDFFPVPAGFYEHDVVATPYTHLYFDLPTAIGRVYGFDPAPDSLGPESAAHVLGAEAAMWTGAPTARSEVTVEQHIFPRLLALAELAWTAQDLRDPDDFTRRLESQQRRLEYLGVALGP